VVKGNDKWLVGSATLSPLGGCNAVLAYMKYQRVHKCVIAGRSNVQNLQETKSYKEDKESKMNPPLRRLAAPPRCCLSPSSLSPSLVELSRTGGCRKSRATLSYDRTACESKMIMGLIKPRMPKINKEEAPRFSPPSLREVGQYR